MEWIHLWFPPVFGMKGGTESYSHVVLEQDAFLKLYSSSTVVWQGTSIQPKLPLPEVFSLLWFLTANLCVFGMKEWLCEHPTRGFPIRGNKMGWPTRLAGVVVGARQMPWDG